MTDVLSPAARRRVEQAVARYPRREAALLPVLGIIQEENGFVSAEAERWTAAELGVAPARVREVLTFYELFRRTPPGRHVLRVCVNLSCHMAGAPRLLDAVKSRFGIGPGETTPDGQLTFETTECLGNCSEAPCLSLDGREYGRATAEALAALIAGGREGT